GQSVERWSGGPSIVVSEAKGLAEFRLDSGLKIDSKGGQATFSPSGNRVSIEQGIHQYLMPRDNASGFIESTTSITAQLPGGLRPGGALVYVTDASGVESSAQFVGFNCEACPVVSGVEDERLLDEFYPGATVTIRGAKFSPSGNTVIFEQQSEQRVFYRFVVPRTDVLLESPEQIKVGMPKEMIKGRFTAVFVADAANRESNQFPMRVYDERAGGPPVISSFRKIASRNPATGDILPGVSVSIFGGRF